MPIYGEYGGYASGYVTTIEGEEMMHNGVSREFGGLRTAFGKY